jgi:hypothetical protein
LGGIEQEPIRLENVVFRFGEIRPVLRSQAEGTRLDPSFFGHFAKCCFQRVFLLLHVSGDAGPVSLIASDQGRPFEDQEMFVFAQEGAYDAFSRLVHSLEG